MERGDSVSGQGCTALCGRGGSEGWLSGPGGRLSPAVPAGTEPAQRPPPKPMVEKHRLREQGFQDTFS